MSGKTENAKKAKALLAGNKYWCVMVERDTQEVAFIKVFAKSEEEAEGKVEEQLQDIQADLYWEPDYDFCDDSRVSGQGTTKEWNDTSTSYTELEE